MDTMDIGLQVLLELNGTPYSFESAEQLLEDFFNEVTKRIQSAVLDSRGKDHG